MMLRLLSLHLDCLFVQSQSQDLGDDVAHLDIAQADRIYRAHLPKKSTADRGLNYMQFTKALLASLRERAAKQ